MQTGEWFAKLDRGDQLKLLKEAKEVRKETKAVRQLEEDNRRAKRMKLNEPLNNL